MCKWREVHSIYTTCRDNQWNPMFSEPKPKHNSVISYDEI